jgi:hypothetical protein
MCSTCLLFLSVPALEPSLATSYICSTFGQAALYIYIYIYIYYIIFIFIFSSTRVWTQVLTLARQVLLPHDPLHQTKLHLLQIFAVYSSLIPIFTVKLIKACRSWNVLLPWIFSTR